MKNNTKMRCLIEKGEFYSMFAEILEKAGYDLSGFNYPEGHESQGQPNRLLSISSGDIRFVKIRKAEGVPLLNDGTFDCALLTGSMALEQQQSLMINWIAKHLYKEWDPNKSAIRLIPFTIPGYRNHFAFMAKPGFITSFRKDEKRTFTLATPYPYLAKLAAVDSEYNCKIYTMSGSVEVAPELGKSDAIFDEIISGATAIENGLETFKTYGLCDKIEKANSGPIPAGNIPFYFAINANSINDIGKIKIITDMQERIMDVVKKIQRGAISLESTRGNSRGKTDNPTPAETLRNIRENSVTPGSDCQLPEKQEQTEGFKPFLGSR